MELFIWKKSSHPDETSDMKEISAEWCVSLCKNKSFNENDFISPRWDLTSTCNPGQNFLELYNALVQVRLATSKTKHDI